MAYEDATLDEIRSALAPEVAANAAFDGWNARAVESAAAALGIDADVARLAFPGGPVDMVDSWFAHIDDDMRDRLPIDTLAAMKIRARITTLVETRLDIVAPNREALRRALAVLALPQNALRAAKLGWRSADVMWRAAGDTATDYNHYTKRAMLGAVYAATIAVFLDDDSEDFADTRAFLARRIENIMQFEKAKAGLVPNRDRLPSLSRFIGRLRYPAV
ncbi:MAG TPA: COQ9 family protein [Sphingomonas sp.]|nr:COQ9 family protein [Sphingomonas sp.]